MEPLEYIRILKRRWKLLAACVLVAGLVAWITTPAKPTNDSVSYTATHQLIRNSTDAAPQALATVALFVKTGEVPGRVAERLDYEGEPAVLAAGVTLTPDETVGTLGITATGTSPADAAERANAFGEEVLGFLGEQNQETQRQALTRLNEQLASLQVEIDALDAQLGPGPATDGGVVQAERDSKLRQYGAALDQRQQILTQPPPTAGYSTLEPALPELATTADGGFSAPTSRVARTGLAVALGLVLGLAVILFVERLDTRLNTREETEEAFHLPVVAEVPRLNMVRDTIVTAVDPASAASEAYRTLRASLVLMPTASLGAGGGTSATKEPQVILVTSPAPGDGKTTTVANLAACFAEAGRSVLVLGCDFRRPEIHVFFEMDERPGIAEVLVDGSRNLASIARPTPVPGVRLAASGRSLRSFGDVAHAGRALVAEARTLADVVIIDTPPLLATNDATELIPAVDAVVVVARVGRTSVDSAKRTVTLLERLSAPAAGVVLVGVPAGEGAYSSYYTSVAPRPGRRRGLLRRRIRSDEINERIQPWRGTGLGETTSAPTTEPSAIEHPRVSHMERAEPDQV
jgi:capsular exopolysaccharide synthesis family protein